MSVYFVYQFATLSGCSPSVIGAYHKLSKAKRVIAHRKKQEEEEIYDGEDHEFLTFDGWRDKIKKDSGSEPQSWSLIEDNGDFVDAYTIVQLEIK